MNPPLHTIPADAVSLADYGRLAAELLDPGALAYIDGGAADEITLRANREAFDALRLRGRVLGGFPGGGHTRVNLLGRERAHPILLAPVALHRLAHTEGERATALGAAAAETTMVVSTQTSVPVEEIASACAGVPPWFQLYMQPDRGFTESLVRRAEAAGCEALVVTVDAPAGGARNREQRAGFCLPPGVEPVLLRGAPQPAPGPGLCGGLMAVAPTWDDVEWLRARTRLPVLLKGVTDAADAARAAASGVAGLVVSNHGGRTLDTLPAALDALPEVVDAVAGRIPVLFDGGIRRGTDVFKALALGASAVMVGRPQLHALAVAGAPGVAHMLRILRAEFEIAMALAGCPSPDRITREALRP